MPDTVAKIDTYTCPRCTCLRPMADRCWIKNQGLMCKGCADTQYFTCPNCDAIIRQNFKRDVGGFSICRGCLSNLSKFDPESYTADDTEYTRIQSTRRFGIELESATDSQYPAMRLGKSSKFGAKYDCTCSGQEFYSPILYGDDGLAEVEKLCQVAEQFGWTADSQCGYHLHLDMQDESLDALRSIAYTWSNLYDIALACVNMARRRDSEYSQDFVNPRQIENASDLLQFFRGTDRYNYFNFQAYYYHGTFENRLHEGTFDQKTICNWIIFNLRITEAAKALSMAELKNLLYTKTRMEKWEVVKEWVGDEEIIAFYESRIRANNCLWLCSTPGN